MNNDLKQINIDYIGVISQLENGLLKYCRVPIPKQDIEILNKMEAMANNDNRTVLDLQDFFQQYFPKSDFESEYNYCAPNFYSSSFVRSAEYPISISYDDYKQKLEDADNETINKYLSDVDVEKEANLSDNQREELEEKRNKNLSDTKEKLRQDYYNKAIRILNAKQYFATLKYIQEDCKNKMYSTETIGWTDFCYRINDDILIHMKSNFGYGRSSYHFINLTYKGINLLPYSETIRYFWVNWVEFKRYTRQYRPIRDNWELALDFVVETANLAIRDQEEFVKKWICNEIEEMITGLKSIFTNTRDAVKRIVTKKHEYTNLICIRDSNRFEDNEFKLYPEEFCMAFKSEKISCALDFLDNLLEVKEIYPNVLAAIEEIKRMNVDLLPEIIEQIKLIKIDINERQNKIASIITKRDSLQEQNKKYYDELERFIERRHTEGILNESVTRNEYLDSHLEFKKIYELINEYSKTISTEQYEINKRNNFIKKLDDCKNKIEGVLFNAA